jgi:hypothetical protein
MLQITEQEREACIKHLINLPMVQVEPVINFLRALKPLEEKKIVSYDQKGGITANVVETKAEKPFKSNK